VTQDLLSRRERKVQRTIRDGFIAALLLICANSNAHTAFANSCSNVDVIGTFDQSGLTDNHYGIFAVGTFRIEGESDESKQPMFNLSTVSCETKVDDEGKAAMECKVIQAVVWAKSEKPNADNPNCSLDLTVSDYSMKELQKNVLSGIEPFATGCFNTILTIDRNTKRIYQTFTRTEHADKYDKISPNLYTCGLAPRAQVLMNCTAWPKIRQSGKQSQTPSRYCDFSSAGDK
jgi:hypothetical protein